MITVIISSVNNHDLLHIKQNIEETIDVPHEVLAYENSKGDNGICSVYNRGTREANNEILCFMHDDVKILTKGWGIKILEAFKNPFYGLIGIAGSSYKTFTPSAWYRSNNAKTLHSNFIQDYKYSNHQKSHYYQNPGDESFSEVAYIDGVWFCTKREIALEYPFDDNLLKGFHCYDVDFSLSVNQNYKVVVTYDILIEHRSEGKFEKEWILDSIKIHKKWHKMLPLNIKGLNQAESEKLEYQIYREYINSIIKWRLPYTKVFEALWIKGITKKIGLVLFFRMNLKAVLKSYTVILRKQRLGFDEHLVQE